MLKEWFPCDLAETEEFGAFRGAKLASDFDRLAIKAKVSHENADKGSIYKGVSLMDIIVRGTSPVKMDPSEEKVTLPSGRRTVRKNRRKNKQDRRKSVREGIFVSLSVDNDRRVLRDRRKAGS